jgi:hypothetical protein
VDESVHNERERDGERERERERERQREETGAGKRDGEKIWSICLFSFL